MNFSLKPILSKAVKKTALCCLVATSVACANKPGMAVTDMENSKFDECAHSIMSVSPHSELTPNSAAKYHFSAKRALSCLGSVPLFSMKADKLKVMQIHALAIVNLLKSGELNQAQYELSRFIKKHPYADLMLADGSSFVDSMNLLLGEVPLKLAAKNSLLNAHVALKSELRRQQYWKVN